MAETDLQDGLAAAAQYAWWKVAHSRPVRTEPGCVGTSILFVEPRDTSRAESIPLVPHWDATLSYDVLEPDGEERSVPFVGRDNLKGALVTTIADPYARGSVLVSGYRGSGKTTLVIETARQAKAKLLARDDGWELFPVPINASEVSASMTTAIVAPEAGIAPTELRLHPNLLLTALLRELANRSSRIRLRKMPDSDGNRDRRSGQQVADHIRETFDKALATTWTKEDQRLEQDRLERTAERTSTVAVSAVPKALATLAIAALAALGVGAAGQGVAEMVASAALAMLAGSLAWTVTSRRTDSQEKSSSVSVRHDKSVHQLETDLKDILAELHKLKLRTVVVLEELDKIDDQGDDLEDVIRYFKNLFTQAPALFFFITDKKYFDAVSAKIKRERRRRSYAIEHTFFTRRIYVGRPSSDDCLDFLAKSMALEADTLRIRDIKETDRARSRSLDSMARFEQSIRYLMYQADNHLFDMKNEMRRFVRERETGPVLEFDDISFPSDEAAMAVFQFLAQRKVRSFGFGPGNSYASELLHDSVYAAFTDVDTDNPQSISDLYPRSGEPNSPNPDPSEPMTGQGDQDDLARAFAIAEQLTVGQERRIRNAVDSLLGDLERGGAIVLGAGEFRWESPAAASYRPKPELEIHEQLLVDNLAAVSAALRPLCSDANADQLFAKTVTDQADEQRERLKGLLEDAQRGEQVISANDAEQITAREERTADALLDELYAAHSSQLSEGFGGSLKPITRSLHILEGTGLGSKLHGDVLVLVAYGRPSQSEATARRMWSEIELRSPTAVGAVWVDPTVSEPQVIGDYSSDQSAADASDAEGSRLRAVSLDSQSGGPPPQVQSIHEAIAPLAPHKTVPTATMGWTDTTVVELLWALYGAIGASDRQLNIGKPEMKYKFVTKYSKEDEVEQVLSAPGGDLSSFAEGSLSEALAAWWSTDEQLMYCPVAEPPDVLRGAANAARLPPIISDPIDVLASNESIAAFGIAEFLRSGRAIATVQPDQLDMVPADARAIVLGEPPGVDAVVLRRLDRNDPRSSDA